VGGIWWANIELGQFDNTGQLDSFTNYPVHEFASLRID